MCSYSVVKLLEAPQIFLMIDYVKKMTVKKPFKNGEYGAFELLLFLFVVAWGILFVLSFFSSWFDLCISVIFLYFLFIYVDFHIDWY